MPTTKRWFYIKACPLIEQCTSQSRKKANLWGETKQDALQALVTHLVRSAHHTIERSEAASLAELAEVSEYEEEVPSEDEGSVVTERERTPRRENGNVRGKGKSQTQLIKETVAETVRVMAGTNPPIGAKSASSTSTLALHAQGPSFGVEIRSGMLQTAIDAIGRACHAAKQVQRISSAAARAFQDEVVALQEEKEAFETIKFSTS